MNADMDPYIAMYLLAYTDSRMNRAWLNMNGESGFSLISGIC